MYNSIKDWCNVPVYHKKAQVLQNGDPVLNGNAEVQLNVAKQEKALVVKKHEQIVALDGTEVVSNTQLYFDPSFSYTVYDLFSLDNKIFRPLRAFDVYHDKGAASLLVVYL